MLNNLKNRLRQLSLRGAHGLDYAAARRVVLVNQFCIIAIALNLVYAVQVLLLDAMNLSVFLWLVLFACLAFLLVMYLNGTEHQRIARWILSSIPVATLFMSAYLVSNGAGLQLYLIVIWTLLFLIFTRQELGALLIFSIVYWLGFLTIEYQFITPALNYTFPDDVISRIYAVSITGTFLSVALVVGLFFNEIHRAEERLQAEHERSERLLRNILPEPIADRLKARNTNNRTQASQRRHLIADGYPEATVLFADIVGFTPLSERLSPEELLNLLNQVFSKFDDIVMQYGLEKIKTIGDAYMLVGGLPNPQPDHCAAVARTALEMQALMPEFSRLASCQLQLRIGIHGGPLVAGVIGQHKFAYDIWGDTVNTASRLESHGEPGRIQVSSTVQNVLKDRFAFEHRGEIQIKGKGPFETWFLLNPLNT